MDRVRMGVIGIGSMGIAEKGQQAETEAVFHGGSLCGVAV